MRACPGTAVAITAIIRAARVLIAHDLRHFVDDLVDGRGGDDERRDREAVQPDRPAARGELAPLARAAAHVWMCRAAVVEHLAEF